VAAVKASQVSMAMAGDFSERGAIETPGGRKVQGAILRACALRPYVGDTAAPRSAAESPCNAVSRDPGDTAGEHRRCAVECRSMPRYLCC
jgi:hypothetical protein